LLDVAGLDPAISIQRHLMRESSPRNDFLPVV
jgi:hypothetical protein